MLEKHHVPDTFRDTILAGVLQARSGLGGCRDDLLSDGEWTAIREAEVRLLFLIAIKSKLSLGRQINFTASSDYGFVSPQLKKPLLINVGMWDVTPCCLYRGGQTLQSMAECDCCLNVRATKPWCGDGRNKKQ